LEAVNLRVQRLKLNHFYRFLEFQRLRIQSGHGLAVSILLLSRVFRSPKFPLPTFPLFTSRHNYVISPRPVLQQHINYISKGQIANSAPLQFLDPLDHGSYTGYRDPKSGAVQSGICLCHRPGTPTQQPCLLHPSRREDAILPRISITDLFAGSQRLRDQAG
jgi:hypothetical protein